MDTGSFPPKNRLEDFFRTKDAGATDDTESTQRIAALQGIAALESEVAKLNRRVRELIRDERRWMILAILATTLLVFLPKVRKYEKSHEKSPPQAKVLLRDTSQQHIPPSKDPNSIADDFRDRRGQSNRKRSAVDQ